MNCKLLRRILQIIPDSWRCRSHPYLVSIAEYEDRKIKDGRAVDLLDPGINLQDVYGSEEFRTKLGLGDLDASGKDKWVTTDCK